MSEGWHNMTSNCHSLQQTQATCFHLVIHRRHVSRMRTHPCNVSCEATPLLLPAHQHGDEQEDGAKQEKCRRSFAGYLPPNVRQRLPVGSVEQHGGRYVIPEVNEMTYV